MTCDIVIRSWLNDFEWLKYSLRSIQRFATGFRNVIVIVPNGQVPPTGVSEKVFYVHESGEGYMRQQVSKLYADAFTDAEFMAYLDSDTIWTHPVTPDDLIVDRRKVRWLYTPYSSLTGDESRTWVEPTGKVMKQSVGNEFMRRHPLVAPRWALESFRQWMWREHGMSLESYVMAQPNREFSEWNALGAYLWFHHHDKVHWMNTDDDMGTTFVWQGYSWGGLSDAIKADLERALS